MTIIAHFSPSVKAFLSGNANRDEKSPSSVINPSGATADKCRHHIVKGWRLPPHNAEKWPRVIFSTDSPVASRRRFATGGGAPGQISDLTVEEGFSLPQT
jgi:hypothetical protein